jgi:ribonuclease P protein component
MERYAVQKELRLKKREDFSRIYRTGKSVANFQFVLYYKEQLLRPHFRLGISTSKKVGNAVVRNRLRRTIKEIWRLHADEILPNYDYIIIVRKAAVDMDYQQMEKSMLHVIKKGSFLIKKNNKNL